MLWDVKEIKLFCIRGGVDFAGEGWVAFAESKVGEGISRFFIDKGVGVWS